MIIIKNNYTNVKSMLKPLDIICFKNSSDISKLISIYKAKNIIIPNDGLFDHIGLIINKRLLNIDILEDNKLYILESNISENKSCNDLYFNSINGIRIRELDSRINTYNENSKNSIVIGILENNPYNNINNNNLKNVFLNIFNEYKNTTIINNFYSFFSYIKQYYYLNIRKTLNTENWIFCSEFIAEIYKKLGIYPYYINSKDITPSDIIYSYMDISKIPITINTLYFLTKQTSYIFI
jgi:hypothetical protein